MQQTPIERAMTKHRNQMKVRYQKFKQCYDRIHTELRSLFQHIQLIFPQFPFNQMNQILKICISKMEANVQEWVQKKIMQLQQESIQLTFKDCWGHIEQQYKPEAEFFTACFSAMRQLIENICTQTIGRINDTLINNIQLMFNIRCILILLKRKDKAKHINSGNYPILRCKAVVMYEDLHVELKRLCGDLLINKWIRFRKQKRKKENVNNKNKRSTVPAKQFCSKLVEYCEYLYEKQYSLVKNKMRLELVNIYEFDDQKRMVICDCLTKITNDTNYKTNIDAILEWFGESNMSVISPIINECNFISDNNFNMNRNNSMIPILATPLICDSSDHDSFSINSSITNNNNMLLYDVNQYPYQGVSASNYLPSQVRYSPMKSKQQLLVENIGLKRELNRLRQIFLIEYQSHSNGIMNCNISQQHIINNGNDFDNNMYNSNFM